MAACWIAFAWPGPRSRILHQEAGAVLAETHYDAAAAAARLKMKLFQSIGGAAAAACIACSSLAYDLPKASRPEEAGFSTERLKRLTDIVRTEVEQGASPGAVMRISRNGKLAYLDALGFRDREQSAAMKPDAIFRIASMTKPIVSVAVMMLVEEGRIVIDNPV